MDDAGRDALNASGHRKQLGLEQVDLLYDAMSVSLAGTLINAIVLSIVLWQVVDHTLLIAWLIVLLFNTLGRWVLTWAWNKQQRPVGDAARWRRYFLVGCVISGLVWGSVPVLLFPPGSLIHQVFLAFIVAGMCAGATTTLHPDRVALFIFLLLAGIPLMARFFMLDNTMGMLMGLMVFFFLLLISLSALRAFKYTMQNIVLRLESAERERQIRTSEEKVRESEKTYHGIFNSLEESVYVVDQSGTILDVNEGAVRMYGYPREDLVGRHASFFSAPGRNDMARVEALGLKAFNGESQHFEFYGRDACGQVFPKDVRLYPGEYFGRPVVIAVAQNISEKKELESQLLQAQKMESLGTLVGGIAHDFNNMLSGIIGNLYVAKKVSEDRKGVVESLERVEGLSFQAAAMIRQLLTFARKDRVDMRPLSLNAFIHEAYELIRLGVPESVDMQCRFCDEDLTINGDATQLQQVLMNLTSNAHDAVAGCDKPVIGLSVMAVRVDRVLAKAHPALAGKRMARLTVTDNGTGIPEDHLDSIFEPFFTTKAVGKGTGLGLAMVYGAVQSHGGFVRVESEIGRGTSFHVYLPLIEQKAVSPRETKTEAVPEGKGETILLVDDEEHVRMTGTMVLESLGYKVMQAVDGREAVEVFAASQDEVSLVVLDVVMPRMGGVEAAKAIRGIRPNMPIIFVTGYDRNKALGSKAAGFYNLLLSKPYRIEDIARAVHDLLNRA